MKIKEHLKEYSIKKCGTFVECDEKVWKHKNMIEFANQLLKTIEQ